MRIWCIIILVCACLLANAQDFFITLPSGNKLGCRITSPNTVSVECRGAKGTLVIPESVKDQGDIYIVTEIDTKAFCGSELKSVTIPKTVKILAYAAFKDCQYLESIILPSGIETIGESCFDGCKNLRNCIIPEGVTVLYCNAFNNCTRLRTVTLPLSLKKFSCASHSDDEVGVFRNCPSLEKIIIPSGSREKFENIINFLCFGYHGYVEKLTEE